MDVVDYCDIFLFLATNSLSYNIGPIMKSGLGPSCTDSGCTGVLAHNGANSTTTEGGDFFYYPAAGTINIQSTTCTALTSEWE